MALSDKYEFIRRLGHGASGDVYLVKHRTLNLLRAVKIVSKHSRDAGLILKEALIIRNLHYQGIPIIYDIDETPDEYYIYEEYVEGITLTDYVHSSSLSLKDILDKTICLCSILDYLHHCGNGILHLDLKPDNIMIDSYDRLWLIDYDNATTQGDILTEGRGSPGFAPPQQYWGTRPDVSWDIYSLGVIILYMSEGTIQSSVHSVRHQQLIPIIRKCMHHSRFMRYRSVSALQKDLENILSGKPDTLKDLPSLELNVGGTDRGVGTTHFCLCLCSFLNRNKISAVVVNCSRMDSYPRICGMAAGMGSISNNVFSFGNVNLITSNLIADPCRLRTYKVIIRDFGDLDTESHINIRLCTPFKPYDEISRRQTISNGEQLFLIWNLCSTKFFYDSVKLTDSRIFNYRMPCVYDFSEGSDLCDNMFCELLADMDIRLTLPKVGHKILKKGGKS
ncbi:MAG: serine/threonine protein kinase [Lachnospiraceae bacterium]